jgi:hypothetical protein
VDHFRLSGMQAHIAEDEAPFCKLVQPDDR